MSLTKGNPDGLITTIHFNYTGGVKNATFTLFDIDMGSGYTDRLYEISAVTSTGAIIGPTSVVGSVDNQVTGSGTNFVVTGTATSSPNSANGNVTISFGATYITDFTFRWNNGNAANGAQTMALADFSFTPMPEVGSSVTALGLCAGTILFGMYRKRRSIR